MKQNHQMTKSFLALFIFFGASASHAFYTVQETGDLLKPEQKQIST